MYKIYAITQGRRQVDISGLLPGAAKPGTIGYVAYYAWCIKGKEATILVDTGMNDEEAEKRRIRGLKYLEGSLKKLDADPASISTIIVTHLHADHFSAHKLYPNATFYVQKKDFEFFTGPGAKFRQVTGYAPNMQEVVKLADAKRIRYLDGDEEIVSGIRVVPVGGHTPGSQVVVVKTIPGEAVICGDAVTLYRNITEGVMGIYADLLPSLLAFDKIRALVSSPDLIIPGHDPLVMEKFPSPMEGVAEIG